MASDKTKMDMCAGQSPAPTPRRWKRIYEATAAWLAIVEANGELSLVEVEPDEALAPLRAARLTSWDPELVCVWRLVARHDRHTALRAGDYLVVRLSGGRYSVVTDVVFVRAPIIPTREAHP